MQIDKRSAILGILILRAKKNINGNNKKEIRLKNELVTKSFKSLIKKNIREKVIFSSGKLAFKK
jgi:hypothetical protein